jgi:acyl carrier protein
VVVALDNVTRANERSIGALISVEANAVDESRVRSFLRTRLPEYMLPAYIILLDSLPVLANGKLDPRRAKQLIESRLQKAEDTTDDDIKRLIVDVVIEVLGHRRFTFDDLFFEIGLDSLALMEMSVRLSGRLGRDISDLAIYMNPTVNRLARFVESNASTTIS